MRYLSADVGGTFTDLVLMDQGRVLVDKVPSGKRGTAGSIAEGLLRISAKAGLKPGDIHLFVHGFTVATNAYLMRRGAKVALLVTEGFRDLLEIGSQQRPKLYPLRQQKPQPVVPRDRVIEVKERIDAFGGVVTALSKEAIAHAVAAVKAAEPEAIAICLNFSFLNDGHERALADALKAALPGVPLYLSSEVNPQMEEYPRANTTALAAYVGPVVDRYLSDVEANLQKVGAPCPLRLMRSDGGVATPRAARRNPAQMLLSGPAAGVIAATELGKRLGRPNLVTFDMGGTSADFSLIAEGEPRQVRERHIGGQPLRLPTLDIETISAGGGSIAWIDRGGALKVGPDSAGAVPGPACYGKGGEAATVTDAAVVLGLIDPDRYLGGEIKLDAKLAAEAVTKSVAHPLRLSVEEAAFGIIAIANVGMVQAIRTLSVERGHDARRFSLLAFGGAGPLFAPYLAEGLSMAEVLVPRYPGVFCAEGLLMSDIRHKQAAAFPRHLLRLSLADLTTVVGQLRSGIDGELAADGIAPDRRSFRLWGDLRYVGQFHELELALPMPDQFDVAQVADAFHTAHQQSYGHADAASPTELVNLRLEGIGRIDRPQTAALQKGEVYRPKAIGQAPAYLGRALGFQTAAHYLRQELRPGAVIQGPALVHQVDSTSLILAGHRASVLSDETLSIVKEGREQAS